MKKFKTVDELISQLQPDKPVYCIRKKSIQLASKLFQEKFPGKILYAVKTNPNKEVVKTTIQITKILTSVQEWYLERGHKKMTILD